MNMPKALSQLIDKKLDRLNTIDLGTITRIDLETWTASVRLKHLRHGRTVELQSVPIAPQRYGAGALWIAPAVGDVVLIAISRYELAEQLRNRQTVEVNELVTFYLSHALIIAGIVTQADAVPAVPEGGILLQHQSGAGIEIDSEGNMTIRAKHISFQESGWAT